METTKKQMMSVTFLFGLLIVGIASMPATASAQAATTTTYMYIDGIPGSSTDAKHQNWINVTSFLQSMQVPPRTSGAIAPQPVCGFEVIKGLDNAGPALWIAAMNGRMLTEVRLEVMVRDVKAYEIRLTNVRISSIMSAGSFQFAETVTLAAMNVRLTSFPQTASGAAGAPVSSSFLCN